MDFIKSLVREYWDELSERIPDKQSTILYILESGHKSDTMNVPNPLRFYRCCWKLSSILSTKIDDGSLPQCLSPLHLTRIKCFIVFSHINYSFVVSLFDRFGTWNKSLTNLAISAFGSLILFNAEGTKYETSQTWEAKQRYFSFIFDLFLIYF